MYIKGHRQILWLLLIQNLKHNVQEPIYCIRVKSICVSQIRNSVECTIQYTVSINQYDLFSHSNYLVDYSNLNFINQTLKMPCYYSKALLLL